MRIITALIILFLSSMALAKSPMSADQLNQWLQRLEKQRLVLDKAISKEEKDGICREGYKYLDIFSEVDPRVDWICPRITGPRVSVS